MALTRMRGRMPLLVFILLALICLGLLGLACACLGDEPALAFERALSAPALAALIEVWSALAVGAFLSAVLAGRTVRARERASPALLQRFLF